MQVSKNQIESARQANLADYFLQNGYECEQHGSELHVRGFGGLYVNTVTNSWFQFSEKHGDTNPVNCLTNILGMDFTSAVSALSAETFNKNFPTVLQNEKIIKPPTKCELPINEHEKKRIFAYLVKERKISAALVQELVNKKILYQGSVKYIDKDGNEKYGKGNAVFIQKDLNGNIVGAEIHGTNTHKRFKSMAGNGDENIFQYPIGAPKKVYAFESAIDLLSFRVIANPEKIKDSLLVSMGGLKPAALKKLEESGLKIYSCVDNDERGKMFNKVNSFQSAGRKLQEEGVKDWNELLQKRIRELSKNIEAPTESAVKKVTRKSPKM